MDWQSEKHHRSDMWFSLSLRAATYEQAYEWHKAALLWKEAALYATTHPNIHWATSRSEFCTLRAGRQPKYNA